MIEAKSIYKSYDKKTFALEDVSLQIKKGQIITVLGHNGAGKSTFLKIIATILAPTRGEICFDTISLKNASQSQLRIIKRKIGFLSEDPILFSNLTPYEYFTYLGQLFGMEDDTLVKTRISFLLKLFNIDKSETKYIETYSSGLKKRIALAAVMMNDPRFVILDEPTNNLDPIGVKIFKQYILKIKSEGVAIILSTHQLEIAEKLSDSIIVIEQGKVKFSGTLSLLDNLFNKSKTKKSLENMYAMLVKEGTSF